MFDYLFYKYKYKVLKGKFINRVKRLALYEKICLAFGIILIIPTIIFMFKNNIRVMYIILAASFVDLVLLIILQNIGVHQDKKLKNWFEPHAKSRMKDVVELLEEFEIDINNKEELNGLIEKAKIEKNTFDSLRFIKQPLSIFAKYIFIPVLSSILTVLFVKDDGNVYLTQATVFLSYFLVIVLYGYLVVKIINQLFNRDFLDIDTFVSDIENVKVFSEKANSYSKKNKLSKKDSEDTK